MDKLKVSPATIARTVVLVTALANTLLTAAGKNPLPWSDNEVYNGVSAAVTVGASIVAWWKNNSFTKEAIQADNYLGELRELGRGEAP